MSQTVPELARELNRRNAKKKKMPALLLMTDTNRLADPAPFIPLLPKNSALILRHHTKAGKEKLIKALKPLAQRHKVRLLVSDDVSLALKHQLDGVHFSERRTQKAAAIGCLPRPKPGLIYTSACHSYQTLLCAEKAGIDAVLVSPLFPTQSHPQSKALARFQRHLITKCARIDCYGLGGIHQKTAKYLKNSSFIGFAGISGLI